MLINLIREYKPEIFLLGASSRGRDLAGSVASVLYTGLTADCTGLDIDPENGLLLQTRPAFGGNIMATIICPDHRPQMATVRYRVFEMPVADSSRQGQVIPIKAAMWAEQITTHVVDSILEKDEINLADARVIVAGGRGVGGPAGFETYPQIGRSIRRCGRIIALAVDAGWISYAHQVGQTGRTVRPDCILPVAFPDKYSIWQV